MTISHESFEIILDLIEIKVNALQIHDKDDARELNKLRKCRQEFLQHVSSLDTKSFKEKIPSSPAEKVCRKTMDSRI